MEETSSLEELDTLSSASLCKDLEEMSKTILGSIADCKSHVRHVISKAKETQPPILQLTLKPRASSRSWMQQHALSENEVTLKEFLDCFLSSYSSQNRLDISTLTVNLAKEEAKLFHLPAGPAHFFDVLAALPTIFH
jgi:hypothetical protein